MEPPVTTPAEFIVAPPFSLDSLGDCVLQAADGTQFKVFRFGLILASPFFKGMFDLPQPGGADSPPKGDIPIIEMTEDRETVYAILQTLYPVGPYRLPNPMIAELVTDAFIKYDIPLGILHPLVSPLYLNTQSLQAHCMELYALAWRLGMEDQAKTASRYTHDIDLTDVEVAQALIKRSGSFQCLFALLNLRTKREEALDDLVKSVRLGTQLCKPSSSTSARDHFTSGSKDQYLHKIQNIKRNARKSLKQPHPVCRDIVKFFGMTKGYSGSNGMEEHTFCQSCPGYLLTSWDMMKDVIAAIEAYPQTISGIQQ